MRERAWAVPPDSGARTPIIASDRRRRPSQRMGFTFRPWRRSRAKRGWQTIAAIASESAYSPKVAAGVRGRCRARRTPAGTPGPTGAKKSARTSATGPPGKCWAAWRSLAAPACPAYRVGSSAEDGSNTSKGLIEREGLRSSGHGLTDQEQAASLPPRPPGTDATRLDATRDLFSPSGPTVPPRNSRRSAREPPKAIVVRLAASLSQLRDLDSHMEQGGFECLVCWLSGGDGLDGHRDAHCRLPEPQPIRLGLVRLDKCPRGLLREGGVLRRPRGGHGRRPSRLPRMGVLDRH